MSALTYGELFAGYDGLGMGIRSVLGGRVTWYADCCKYDKNGNAGHTTPHGSPCAILAHHHPSLPNLGDVTKVDWASVEPVDVITGGSPCQDLSHAGKRAGMKAGTRSGLWASMCDAIDIIRPRLVVWENVRGALSAEADSDLEQCPRCVGDPRDRGPVLRALGRVLGDLADLGYVGQVRGLRAADVGAAHGRFRVFVFATPADAELLSWGEGAGDGTGSGATSSEGQAGGTSRHRLLGADGPPYGLTPIDTPPVMDGQMMLGLMRRRDVLSLLPTPRVTQAGYADDGRGGKSLDVEARLLPTPRATDGTKGGPNQRGSSGDLMLPSAVHQLLPTPTTSDAMGSRNSTAWRANGGVGVNIGDTLTDFAWKYDGHNDPRMPANEPMQDWREYESAIRRQEAAFGRPAPLPTEPGAKGQPRLSPRFVEWLMGLPEGHVTDPAIGISRNDQLKALGNGVVPQQAAAAARAFLHDTQAAS